ncbi:hypothetical protein BC826DRAFT_992785 [Russula brevipes]|nr:hypothetical protein BC826DRAFT_992785 [Russula brevipes]
MCMWPFPRLGQGTHQAGDVPVHIFVQAPKSKRLPIQPGTQPAAPDLASPPRRSWVQRSAAVTLPYDAERGLL